MLVCTVSSVVYHKSIENSCMNSSSQTSIGKLSIWDVVPLAVAYILQAHISNQNPIAVHILPYACNCFLLCDLISTGTSKVNFIIISGNFVTLNIRISLSIYICTTLHISSISKLFKFAKDLFSQLML